MLENSSCNQNGHLAPEECRVLLKLARWGLTERASGREPVFQPADMPVSLLAKRGCFVTLFKRGQLRGCIGHVLPQMPLGEAVVHNACAAGFYDPRFEPVSPGELGDLEIEISVLSDLTPLNGNSPDDILSTLRPGIDGVLLRHGAKLSTFLPQVWDTIPEPAEFLSRLCLKAGWNPEAWKSPETSISIYQVASFGEQ